MVLLKGNPIQQRLELLEELWMEATRGPELCLVRWRVPRHDAKLIEVFYEVQTCPGTDVPDLFVRLRVPFNDQEAYGAALCENLQSELDAARDEMAEAEVSTEWKVPAGEGDTSDVQRFAECVRSFAEHYRGLPELFVFVLSPDHVTDGTAWEEWLRALMQESLPGNVRIAVTDSAESAVLDALCEEAGGRAVTLAPELNLRLATQEILQSTPGRFPGDRLRRIFVGLTGAAEMGDIAQVQTGVAAGLTLARSQSWPDQEVVLQMALGTTLLGAGRAREALASYRQSTEAARKAVASGHVAGPKLLVQSRLAEAAALVGDGAFGEAAPVYEEAAPLAAENGDHLIAMDAWRMAAYCHEQTAAWDRSWSCGHAALDAAENIEASDRPASTLPFVGQGLLRALSSECRDGLVGRLLRAKPDSDREQQVRQRMTALLGEEWESLLPAEVAQ